MSAPDYANFGHRVGGDITGGGSGAGARGAVVELRAAGHVAEVRKGAGLGDKLPFAVKRSKVTKSRPMVMADGAAQDFALPVFESRADLARHEWETEHAYLVAEVAGEHELGKRLLAIGRRAGARAARRLLAQKGVAASDTSIDDAASEAVLSVLQHVRGVDRLTAEQWTRPRVLRVLGLYAARGAQKSLTGWARVGMTGDNSQAVGWLDWASMAAEVLQEAASGPMQAAGAGAGSGAPGSADDAARRSAARWVFRVGLGQFRAGLARDMHGPARAAALRAARSRCRVVVNVLFGSSLPDACALASFSTVRKFAESCTAAGFWEALRDAAETGRDGWHTEPALVAQRHHALEAGKLKRELLALGDVRPVLTAPERSSGRAGTFRRERARGQSRTDRAALDRWQVWCSLWERYQVAKGKAIHWRNVARAARKADRAAWARIEKGIKSSRCADLKALLVPRKARKARGERSRFRI